MKFLNIPDYYSSVENLQGFDLIVNIIWFLITFYGTMILFIILNALLMVSICWSMLLICRLFGLPWVDGTTKGFINRE